MTGPYLTLCTSEDELRAVLKKLKCTEDAPFTGNEQSNGTSHVLRQDGKNLVCVVCVEPTDDLSAMLALLVHESVHVWHAHCDDIGDKVPSEESQAYGVQSIAYQLMTEYMRRVESEDDMGGKPSKGTPADKRLGANKQAPKPMPNAGKGKGK